MSASQIILTREDFCKLKEMKCFHHGSDYEKLEEEIKHAKIVGEGELPRDIVTMNRQITLLNMEENKKINMTIVYPCDADFFQHKISVLSPLGMTLLGLKVNQVINWTFPDGDTKTLKVLGVQPQSTVKVIVH
ncbi:MAG: hypothetical protein A2X86_14450 [Bdellovibrionales bacterium GWA2_49_15]|nr:MAG: hypothetical protein A2X86_14450 [Bdellovibrionales bacterium GWA2_49_15]